jgi:plastocyanin
MDVVWLRTKAGQKAKIGVGYSAISESCRLQNAADAGRAATAHAGRPPLKPPSPTQSSLVSTVYRRGEDGDLSKRRLARGDNSEDVASPLSSWPSSTSESGGIFGLQFCLRTSTIASGFHPLNQADIHTMHHLFMANPSKIIRFRHLTRLVFFGVVALGSFIFTSSQMLAATTFNVTVAPGGAFSFDMKDITIQVGDTVKWTWDGDGHSVTSGIPNIPDGLFDSTVLDTGATFSFTFTTPGVVDYYCKPHGACCGMVGSVTVTGASPTPTPTPTATPTATPTPTPSPSPTVTPTPSPSPSPSATPSPTPTPTPTPAQALNISTRLQVLTGDEVGIGGFIITGTETKQVLLRAIGPSLSAFGITNPLADPLLELHAQDGSTIATNDNWRDADNAGDIPINFQPTNDLESAILTTLDPGMYTTIVSGGTGVGLVEAYDLDDTADSELANISTRGFVDTGDNVMIGGFILGGQGENANVVIRALGPSLTPLGVSGALPDPTLELHDANGTTIKFDDNWQDDPDQKAAIEQTDLQPKNDLESAIFATLPAGGYTAIVAGKDGVTGVGLVEVYKVP